MKKITDLIVCWFGAGVIYAGLLSAAISDEPVPNPAQAPDEAPGPESYSDNQYPLPRATGQLSFITAGAFYPYGPDQIAATEYWGLRHTDSWSDILVRGEKTGKLYMIANDMIRAQPGASLTAGLSFGYESAPDNMKPTACHKPWTGEAPPERIEGDNVVRTAVNADGQMEVITYGPEILSWKTRDSGHVDLEGTLATPGSQFLLPWRDATGATSAMFYQKQYYSVQGTYCGETVKGHVMIENIWGDVPYSQSWWVQNRVGSWASFITEYDDGTRESGTFLCGEYAAKGALIVNDKGGSLAQHDRN